MHGCAHVEPTAATSRGSAQSSRPLPIHRTGAVLTVPRRHRKLHYLTVREEKEEKLRDFLPERPSVPPGWTLSHDPGTCSFTLSKAVEIRSCGVEWLTVYAMLERKQYESTYRADSGEREEQEYFNFALFIKKQRHSGGGLEFGMTAIDYELVVDSLVVHPTHEHLDVARRALGVPLASCRSEDRHARWANRRTCLQLARLRDYRYRGPRLNELDEDLSDEILDYLDERGVNNAFAEYIMSQCGYYEQQEYIHWLRLLRRFAK